MLINAVSLLSASRFRHFTRQQVEIALILFQFFGLDHGWRGSCVGAPRRKDYADSVRLATEMAPQPWCSRLLDRLDDWREQR